MATNNYGLAYLPGLPDHIAEHLNSKVDKQLFPELVQQNASGFGFVRPSVKMESGTMTPKRMGVSRVSLNYTGPNLWDNDLRNSHDVALLYKWTGLRSYCTGTADYE
ncbi:MAG: hypothetical protein WD267_03035 [Balneolales bacterium]